VAEGEENCVRCAYIAEQDETNQWFAAVAYLASHRVLTQAALALTFVL